MALAQVDQPAPPLQVSEWVQGNPGNLADHLGKVILIEVFQVNCPGCFVGGLPEAIDVYLQLKDRPLEVWGLATAFEDFRLNSLDNLRLLLDTGEVVGETFRHLAEQNLLSSGRIQYFLPFPVAWDRITPRAGTVSKEETEAFILRDFPQFDSMPANSQEWVRSQVVAYLEQKEMDAATFDSYGLKGTPSAILIDKKGILRHKLFGSNLGLKSYVDQLLEE